MTIETPIQNRAAKPVPVTENTAINTTLVYRAVGLLIVKFIHY